MEHVVHLQARSTPQVREQEKELATKRRAAALGRCQCARIGCSIVCRPYLGEKKIERYELTVKKKAGRIVGWIVFLVRLGAGWRGSLFKVKQWHVLQMNRPLPLNI